MPDADAAALLRAVLDEICASLSSSDPITPVDGASKLPETVKQGRPSLDDLKMAGKEASRRPPTMWR